MVNAFQFRLFCSTVSILGLAFILASNAVTPAKVVGVLFCIALLAFGFAVTGRFRKYILGEQMDQATADHQSYGRMGVG